jgi:penicillin-binding protein 1C
VTGASGSLRWLFLFAAGSAAALTLATLSSMRPLPARLDLPPGEVSRAEVVDRHGQRLSVTYENRWNLHDRIELHAVPAFLRDAVIEAEDRRFSAHDGVDWRARGAALWQNLRAGRFLRGASTISEQVVRMLHPRPRTLWSRWLEGFEAARLEERFSKGDILAFYLNQVPYARQRRGVVQAARDAFGRDLGTLSRDEMLALAVLVRSPSRLDPRRAPGALGPSIQSLARRLVEAGRLPASAVAAVASRPLEVRASELAIVAPAFVRHVRAKSAEARKIHTTLDGRLQARLQPVLDEAVRHLASRGALHGAALAIDHRSGEVLLWMNARSGSEIDAVLSPRQPGSTLKPFVYALALEQGWTAATLIDDAPTSSAVGNGLHRYRNYSRLYRGPVRLRIALANSLNVPAVRTMQSLPKNILYRRLQALGFDSLTEHPEFYGEGLALGNGEVTLRELVSAYAVLARGGLELALTLVRADEGKAATPRRLFDADVSTLVADILADADARAAEFGRGGVLDFPVPAAVKTGTSNDYRDAWALGFSDRYTAGVWMGDPDRRAMAEVTGSLGPAGVLRAIFAGLHRLELAAPLRISPRLRRAKVCAVSGSKAGETCPAIEEWFRPERTPTLECPLHSPQLVTSPGRDAAPRVEVLRPTPGLHLAMDPRIPDPLEVFAFSLQATSDPSEVEWIVDGEPAALRQSEVNRWEWPLSRGAHRVSARVRFAPDLSPIETREVAFFVR